jgi:hypothetical protein
MRPSSTSILTRALELTHKFGWTRGAMAVDTTGEETIFSDPGACKFCTLGFIARAGNDLNGSFMNAEHRDAINRVTVLTQDPGRIAHWNDHHATGIEDVRELFKKALEE